MRQQTYLGGGWLILVRSQRSGRDKPDREREAPALGHLAHSPSFIPGKSPPSLAEQAAFIFLSQNVDGRVRQRGQVSVECLCALFFAFDPTFVKPWLQGRRRRGNCLIIVLSHGAMAASS